MDRIKLTKEYARSLRKAKHNPATFEDKINEVKGEVALLHNNDTGKWVWAVAAYEPQKNPFDAWWMNAFKTKKEAVKFVKEQGWEIMNT